MPTRHETLRGRRCSALLLASALVLLSWFAGGAAHASGASAVAPTAVSASTHSGTGDDGHQHASSVDHAPRHANLHVHQVAPDVAPAPVVRLDAPREVGVVEQVQARGPPVAPVSTTSASRAPPA
ncbi:hypothetical protein [Solicola sp. PLA-1-18]|uniref:hypothetical protein n=1 Tax=Solicola sp. PLA-1-18 TaxID=3380532 RepID=UPI003B765532